MIPRIQLSHFYTEEDGGYVVICPELGITTQGDTYAEAQANMLDAITLFFEVATAQEVLNRYNEYLLQRNVVFTFEHADMDGEGNIVGQEHGFYLTSKHLPENE